MFRQFVVNPVLIVCFNEYTGTKARYPENTPWNKDPVRGISLPFGIGNSRMILETLDHGYSTDENYLIAMGLTGAYNIPMDYLEIISLRP